MTVHNHGTEEGKGLACRELLLVDGSPIGECLVLEKQGELVEKQSELTQQMSKLVSHADQLVMEFRANNQEFKNLMMQTLRDSVQN